mmetsp:Transcript_20173/g.31011  ORF Transcript_20173/g.31011 Transcript_20173/m.31011 type:complete len:296 (+) Transcript_20173:58-945(+)
MAEGKHDLEMNPLSSEEEKEVIPLVTAVEIDETGPQKQPAKKLPTVRVVAPSNLPPCYRFAILYQEEASSSDGSTRSSPWKTGYVATPVDGVTKGQTFEAQVLPPTKTIRRVTGNWDASEFDLSTCCCNDKTDTDFCLLAWFCSPIAWACLYEKLSDLGPDYNPRPAIKSVGAISLFLMILYIVDIASRSANKEETHYSSSKTAPTRNATTVSDLGPFLGIGLTVFSAYVRSKVRAHHKIKSTAYSSENCVCDILCVWCFSPCSVLQAYRHMRNAQEHPNLGYISAPPPSRVEIV